MPRAFPARSRIRRAPSCSPWRLTLPCPRGENRSEGSGETALVDANWVKWIFLPAQKRRGNTKPFGCRVALHSNWTWLGSVASLALCGSSHEAVLHAATAAMTTSLCRLVKLCSQNRTVVKVETTDHSRKSKLEKFRGQFAVVFPVMMKVSHSNILAHLIFSQTTSKLLQQTCDHLVRRVASSLCSKLQDSSQNSKCFRLKAEDAAIGANAADH